MCTPSEDKQDKRYQRVIRVVNDDNLCWCDFTCELLSQYWGLIFLIASTKRPTRVGKRCSALTTVSSISFAAPRVCDCRARIERNRKRTWSSNPRTRNQSQSPGRNAMSWGTWRDDFNFRNSFIPSPSIKGGFTITHIHMWYNLWHFRKIEYIKLNIQTACRSDMF